MSYLYALGQNNFRMDGYYGSQYIFSIYFCKASGFYLFYSF